MNTEYINSFPFDPTEFPLNIEAAGISKITESYVTDRKQSYCYILEYIIAGQGRLICENKTYEINAGDVYLLPKGSTHRYYPSKTWDKIWFSMDGSLVRNLIYAYGLQNTVVFRGVNEKKLFEDLYEITSMKADTKEIMTAAAIQFHVILQHMHKNATKYIPENSINAIKTVLDQNLYQRDISIREIAKKFSLSQVQIISAFKKTFNVTPYQYFMRKRIELAASMLLDTNMSVKEVSEMLNYADQPCFTNSFKKIMGCSPSEYRRSNQSAATDANFNNKLVVDSNPFNSVQAIVNRR